MSENGASFNAQVEATAFAGTAKSDINQLKRDMAEVKTDVRWLRDNVRPVAMIVGGIPTVLAVISLWRAFQ